MTEQIPEFYYMINQDQYNNLIHNPRIKFGLVCDNLLSGSLDGTEEVVLISIMETIEGLDKFEKTALTDRLSNEYVEELKKRKKDIQNELRGRDEKEA